MVQDDLDKARPLYEKYYVERIDGSSAPGNKHSNCFFYVLDVHHDKFAKPALLAYADACENEYPRLAEDLRQLVNGWNQE